MNDINKIRDSILNAVRNSVGDALARVNEAVDTNQLEHALNEIENAVEDARSAVDTDAVDTDDIERSIMDAVEEILDVRLEALTPTGVDDESKEKLRVVRTNLYIIYDMAFKSVTALDELIGDGTTIVDGKIVENEG